MDLPGELRQILEALRRVGRPRIVGGVVRDWLLGLPAKDFDIEVSGLDYAGLRRALAPFGRADVVGRSFGVLKLRTARAAYDFSLPRRESKIGTGHRGFEIRPDPTLSDRAAAARRDFTVNAIAWDPFSNEIIDPFDGRTDLKTGILRHTGPSFADDPLRVLRAFQLAARFDFSLAPETAVLCRNISSAHAELPVERIWGEWDKWAVHATRPSRGIAVLAEAGWLQHYPELAALDGTPQDPEWHPEGDVLAHTQACLDALVAQPAWPGMGANQRRVLMLATLSHDLGKPETTLRELKRGVERWVSPGHETAGIPHTESLLQRIGAPRGVIERVRPLVANHMVGIHSGAPWSDAAVRRLARRLHPATIDDLSILMRADHDGHPPRHSETCLAAITALCDRARALTLQAAAPRPILLGRHLIALGLKPGSAFKPLLDAAFEAQLDGTFTDEANGLVWLQNHLQSGTYPIP